MNELIVGIEDYLKERQKRGVHMEVEIMLERALTALKAQGWQPIESAPKDDQLVALRVGNKRPFIGYHVFDEDETGKRSAWMDADESFIEYKPTHWMPLPEPPSAELNKDQTQ